MSPAPTSFEAEVLLRVLQGRDPWLSGVPSRGTSQALGRLRRKGYVDNQHRGEGWQPTELARCWLTGMQVVSAEKALQRTALECGAFMRSSAPTIVHRPGIKPLCVN